MLARSPLEARKRELSDELKKLKARMLPMGQTAMGPPPPRLVPPTARGPPAAAGAPRPSAGAAAEPACSPVVRAATVGTPATQATAAPSGDADADAAAPSARGVAPTPRSPAQPTHGPFASRATRARDGALSELEESQRLLEEKLAALKRKLDD